MLNSNDLEQFLDQRGVQARILHLNEPTPTVPAAAQAVGVSPDKIVKSLLFLINQAPVLAIATGVQDVDRRALAKRFGVGRKRVKLAGPEEVLAITGYAVGAVPPIGWITAVEAYIDPSVLRHDRVYAGGGDINALMEISPDDIMRLSGAAELELTASEDES